MFDDGLTSTKRLHAAKEAIATGKVTCRFVSGDGYRPHWRINENRAGEIHTDDHEDAIDLILERASR